MSNSKLTKKFSYLFTSLIFLSTNGYSLSLDEYLKQVTANNDEFTAAKLLAEAGFSRSEEGFLVLSPNLVGGANYTKDAQPPISDVFPNAKNVSKTYQVGVAKKFTTGTNVKLSYDNYHTENIYPSVPVTPGSPLPPKVKYWTVKPNLSIEQPLLRNWLGAETKALVQAKNAQALAEGHRNNFNKKKILAEAESAYWDLATIQANIVIKKDSVKRSSKLVEWAERRSKLGLGNDSDYLQAKSSQDQRKFELESLLDQQKAVARLFNAFRTIPSSELPDNLASFKKLNIAQLKKHTQIPEIVREDLAAQYQVYLANKAQAEISKQNIAPDVNLNMQYFPSGRDKYYGDTARDALNRKHNNYSVGVNFSVPLDRKLVADLNNSYQAQSRAALLEYTRKKFELTNEWQRLVEQFNLYVNQLHIAEAMVKTQESKLKNEEDLLKNGRTTTFQTLQFEDDYFNAQAQYLDTKNKLLKLTTMMKLFNT